MPQVHSDNRYAMFIDDLRDASMYYSFPIVTVRSYDEAVQYIEEHGLPDFISFDHDLGDVVNTPERTGYTFAKYLIEYIMDHCSTARFDYVVHSANPVGKANIEGYLSNAFANI